MKENVLDLLMYLFENYMEDEPGLPVGGERESLQMSLLEAGYSPHEIDKAFDWLDALGHAGQLGRMALNPSQSIRLYTEEEMGRLDVECRGFLLQLEDIGVVSARTRELVIDRVMALEEEDMDVERLKWVILLVLSSQPGEEAAFAWMEDLVFQNFV
ncbi:MAG: DUF494 domain-containing protein, partial [Halothiobacillaceae bacterium]|nr:DUF494 domain-containing protein [Halothiobacillaceae bacterium]